MSLERLLSASRFFRFVGAGVYLAVTLQLFIDELGGRQRYTLQAAKGYIPALHHEYLGAQPVFVGTATLDCASKMSTNELRAQQALSRRDGYSCLLDALDEAQLRWDEPPGYNTLFS